MMFRPLQDNIVVKPVNPIGKIKRPVGSELKGDDDFEVVEVGPGRIGPDGQLMEMGLKPGDKVIMNARMIDLGAPLRAGEEMWLVIPAQAVLAVIEPDAGDIECN